MRERITAVLLRARYAAIGAAVGAGIGGLFSRNAASTGGAIGGLVGATVAETRGTLEGAPSRRSKSAIRELIRSTPSSRVRLSRSYSNRNSL